MRQCESKSELLIKAAFYADLDGIKKANFSQSELLHKSTVELGYLQSFYRDLPIITRTGTALQMALYADDLEMVLHFREVMDRNEFQSQFIEAMKYVLSDEAIESLNYSLLDCYDAAQKVLQDDAEELCKNLEPFLEDTIGDGSIPVDQEMITPLMDSLYEYVRTHPFHNPYILEKIYEIFSELSCIGNRGESDYYETYGFRDNLLYRITGVVQTFLPPCWLSYFSAGIQNIIERSPLFRSFYFKDGNHKVNNLASIVFRLGSGEVLSCENNLFFERVWDDDQISYESFVESRQENFRDLFTLPEYCQSVDPEKHQVFKPNRECFFSVSKASCAKIKEPLFTAANARSQDNVVRSVPAVSRQNSNEI